MPSVTDSSTAPLACPAGLAYLPYQEDGIRFLLGRRGALLADEMGLGKTIQAIGMLNNYAWRRVLIIPPAHLRLLWRDELTRWLIHDAEIAFCRTASCPALFPSAPDGRLVVIAHYEAVVRHVERLRADPWDVLIVDEAHYCKSQRAQRTQAVLGWYERGRLVREPIRARRIVMMTGTPIWARPLELWPLVQRLDPQGLGRSFFRFALRYCDAHQEYVRYGERRWVFDGASNLDELRERLRGIMLRRTKQQVLRDLPPKQRTVVALSPTPEQRSLIRREREVLGIAETEMIDGFESLAERLDGGFEIGDLASIRHQQGLLKIPQVCQFAEDLLEQQSKIVVFAHHVDVAEGIAKGLAKHGAVAVTGAMAPDERHALVDRFQRDTETRVIVGTIGAMGTGVTLTAASTVVFAELDWTPAVVEQAEDRCHRVGQRDSVTVYYVVADRSVDAAVARALSRKASIFGQLLGPRRQVSVQTTPVS